MTATQDLQSTYPPNNAVRVGTVVSSSEGVISVSVQGEIIQCGYLNTTGLLYEGGPVAVVRGEASWLALGMVSTTMSTQRIATTVATSNSGAFTALTEVLSVTCPMLYAGVTYSVETYLKFTGTNIGDIITSRIRQDSIAGTDIQLDPNRYVAATTGTTAHAYAEYTPAIDEPNKVFIVAAARGGVGTIALSASSTQPSYLYVDYVRGL